MSQKNIQSKGYLGANVAHGIMFHHFHGQGNLKSQGSIDAQKFVDLIEFIQVQHRIIDPESWLEKSLAGRLEPNELCLTFDDALLCQKGIALPILKNMGLTAFIFVYSSVFEGVLERLEIYRNFRTTFYDDIHEFYDSFFAHIESSVHQLLCSKALKDFSPENYLIESPFYDDSDRKFRFLRDDVLGPQRYSELMEAMIEKSATTVETLGQGIWMEDDDLVALAGEGHNIGLHSYSHPTVLSDLLPPKQEEEYSRNIMHLNRVLGQAPIALSHPCNSYDADTLIILKRLGIQVGFRDNMSLLQRQGLEFPREDHTNIVRMMG